MRPKEILCNVALSILSLAGMLAANPAAAQLQRDHLKCYEVLNDQNVPAEVVVNLFNQFGLEPGCEVQIEAQTFCTPAAKVVVGGGGIGDDPRGPALQSNFTCYRVQCPDSPKRRLHINDQFGARDIGIEEARMLCTPTLSVLLAEED
jgi:hypothetical protein